MFRDAAALYVGLGFKVFPLGEGTKLPAIKGGHGFKDASDDFDAIEDWAKRFPRANIAIATGEASGIVVIDIDPRNGGADSVAALAAKGFLFPAAPEAKTGNNGRHLYFKLPRGLRASKDKLGKGIDVKADGGYVVAAPSRIDPSEQGPGGCYKWVRSPADMPLGPLPKWVLDKLIPKPVSLPRFEPVHTAVGAMKSLEGMARKLASAGKGTRNDLLNWSAFKAGQMVREGKIGAATVDARLTQAGLASGLTLPEVKATIASGIRGALQSGGST